MSALHPWLIIAANKAMIQQDNLMRYGFSEDILTKEQLLI